MVEDAIRCALTELLPSDEERERRRTALRSEIQKIEEEQGRLVAAIAAAGQVDALAQALREREHRKTRLVAELASVGESTRHGANRVAKMERELRDRLAEWRALLKRQAPLARQVVSRLLDGRIAWTPHVEERRYEYQGRVKLDHLLAGSVFTEGGIPVRGFEPRSRG